MATVGNRRNNGEMHALYNIRRDPLGVEPLRSAKRVHRVTEEMIAECLRDPTLRCVNDYADKLGVHPETMQKHLKKMGIPLPMTTLPRKYGGLFVKGHTAWNKGLFGISEEKIRVAHELELSEPQMADYLGCTQQSVSKRLKMYGLRPHGKSNPDYVIGYGFKPHVLFENVCKAYADGFKAKDVAEKYKIPESKVITIWKVNGFTEYLV